MNQTKMGSTMLVGVGVGIVSGPRDSGVPPLRQALSAKTKSISKSINESITELA